MVLLEKAKYKFFNVDFICLALVEWETSMLLLKSGFLLPSHYFRSRILDINFAYLKLCDNSFHIVQRNLCFL